jgi:hypothetical protein
MLTSKPRPVRMAGAARRLDDRVGLASRRRHLHARPSIGGVREWSLAPGAT